MHYDLLIKMKLLIVKRKINYGGDYFNCCINDNNYCYIDIIIWSTNTYARHDLRSFIGFTRADKQKLYCLEYFLYEFHVKNLTS